MNTPQTEHRCRTCGSNFTVFEEDLEYYRRIGRDVRGQRVAVPSPTLCPDCRKQRRLAFRNERSLYVSKSALSGKPVVSVFSPDKPVIVYDYDEWWSDAVDGLRYGRAIDFTRPFFEQFGELLQAVPQMALIGSDNEDCPYCHLLANCRRCYLIVESSNNEDCYYCYWIQKCVDCVDTSFSHECRHCYEIDNCYNCYELKWSKDCQNCSTSAFLENCIGCESCFGCVNLVQKKHCIFNVQHTEREYREFLSAAALDSRASVQRWREKLAEFSRSQPKKYAHILQSENCVGDYIQSSRNCFECYHAHDAEECRYAEHVWRNSRYNMDVSTAGRDAELIYECINVGINSYNVQFSIQCWGGSHDLAYCYNCFHSNNLFGCVGLKKNEHCILNVQYSPSEFAALRERLIRHMEETGEFGEFFPPSLSPFGYNETAAYELAPLDRNEALMRGFRWCDYQAPGPKVRRSIPATDLPDKLEMNFADLLDTAVQCAASGRPYRFINQELDFYRRASVPLPQLHPDERHRQRMATRNPQRLFACPCADCGGDMMTSHAASSLTRILCEHCYPQAIL